jgi:hypothetical protein
MLTAVRTDRPACIDLVGREAAIGISTDDAAATRTIRRRIDTFALTSWPI